MFFATALPVNVVTNPPLDKATEQHIVAMVTRAGEVIRQLDQRHLMRQLKTPVSTSIRTAIESQLRHEFKTALMHNVPAGLVSPLATMLARSIVVDVHFEVAFRGNSIIVCFLCLTVDALYKLTQMITSGFMHAVFTEVIDCQTPEPTTVDVYIRADDFGFSLSSLTCPKDKGWLLDIQLYTAFETRISNVTLKLIENKHLHMYRLPKLVWTSHGIFE